MKTYAVRVPITGFADIEVEAESEDAAIEKAVNEVTMDNLSEWEATSQVVRGNVFYGRLNEAEAEEVS